MKVRRLSITNFRGIKYLQWCPPATGLVFLVGPGDSGKSTVLDALELALGARWSISTSRADIYLCDPLTEAAIEVVLGDLPTTVLGSPRLANQFSGWVVAQSALRDDPDDAAEPVLRIRFAVSADEQPTWSVQKQIEDETRSFTLGAKTRRLFGVSRLGVYADRLLTWADGSVLSRLTEGSGFATDALERVRRTLAEADVGEDVDTVTTLQTTIQAAGTHFGVTAERSWEPGIDPRYVSLRGGALSLHDGDVPARQRGSGVKRLLSVALHVAAGEGSGIALVDEVEAGLEPHRVRNILKALRAPVKDDDNNASPSGQVIGSTHSAVAVRDLATEEICVVRNDGGDAIVRSVPNELSRVVRSCPEALLAPKVIVCEGKTELALLLGLDGCLLPNRMESLGAVLVDGGGSDTTKRASALRALGYEVLTFLDGDKLADLAPTTDELRASGIKVVHWTEGLATEERLAKDATAVTLRRLVEWAGELSATDTIAAQVRAHLPPAERQLDFDEILDRLEESEIRAAVGAAAKKKGWFKSFFGGELIGKSLTTEIENVANQSELAICLRAIFTWISYDT